MTSGVDKLSSTSEKLKALKCQLDFKVLEHAGPKEVFFMSTKNDQKKLTVDISCKQSVCSVFTSTHGSSKLITFYCATQESLVRRRICKKW